MTGSLQAYPILCECHCCFWDFGLQFTLALIYPHEREKNVKATYRPMYAFIYRWTIWINSLGDRQTKRVDGVRTLPKILKHFMEKHWEASSARLGQCGCSFEFVANYMWKFLLLIFPIHSFFSFFLQIFHPNCARRHKWYKSLLKITLKKLGWVITPKVEQ